MLKKQVLPQGVEIKDLFAFESNNNTRAMFKKHGVRSRKIRVPEDLPEVGQILSDEPVEEVLPLPQKYKDL